MTGSWQFVPELSALVPAWLVAVGVARTLHSMSIADSTAHARRSRLFWVTTSLVVTMAAVLLTTIRVRDDAYYLNTIPWQHRAVEEFIGAYCSLVLLPALARFVWRYPPSFRLPLRTVVAYAIAFVGYWLAHTSLIWIVRLLVFEHATVHPVQEMLHDALVFGSFVACAAAWDAFERMRLHEVETELLRGAASEAQLVALRARLHPHFLFNTMNTISSVMYDDPERADTMISHLADMLRILLRQPAHEITLSEELDLVAKYAFLVRARFGSRVEVHTEIADDTLGISVPALLLQPLVENAVQHGLGADTLQLVVWVRARLGDDGLELEVTDNGRGKDAPDALRGSGLGLAGSADRLRLLYGARARLDTSPVAGNQGFCVRVLIPMSSEVQ